MGNICRSPAAEATFRHLVKQEDLAEAIVCDSAGTIDYHTGAAPDIRMRTAARDRGIQMVGTARQIESRDLDKFDLILCMDSENHEYVESLYGGRERKARLRMFCEFVSDSDAREVPDPYYGGHDGFDDVMDLLEDGCSNLLEYVRKKAHLNGSLK